MNSLFLIETLSKRIKSLLVWFLPTLALFLACSVVCTAMLRSGMPEILRDMLSSLPAEITGDFSVNNLPDFTNFSVNYSITIQAVMLILCLFACHTGVSACYDKSTFKLCYSLPYTRKSLSIIFAFSRLFNVLVMNILLIAICIINLLLIDKSELISKVLYCFFVYLISEIVFLTFGLIISLFLKDYSPASSYSFGIFIISLCFYVIGKLFPNFYLLKYFSPSTLFNAVGIVGNGYTPNVIHIYILILLALCFFIAYIVVIDKKKDI